MNTILRKVMNPVSYVFVFMFNCILTFPIAVIGCLFVYGLLILFGFEANFSVREFVSIVLIWAGIGTVVFNIIYNRDI